MAADRSLDHLLAIVQFSDYYYRMYTHDEIDPESPKPSDPICVQYEPIPKRKKDPNMFKVLQQPKQANGLKNTTHTYLAKLRRRVECSVGHTVSGELVAWKRPHQDPLVAADHL